MVNEVEKIDFMDVDENDESKLLLIISDHLEWKGIEMEHLYLLQEKLNNYVSFILDRQYQEHYSQEFVCFEIVIFLQYLPKKKFGALLSFFREELKRQFPEMKIDVTYRMLDAE